VPRDESQTCTRGSEGLSKLVYEASLMDLVLVELLMSVVDQE
jgi:hypothetical protein